MNEWEIADKWDRLFYRVAIAAAVNSECFSRNVGTVLVRDKTIISTGYNGPPRGVPHCDERFLYDPSIAGLPGMKDEKQKKCPRRVLGYGSGKGLEYCIAAHAEVNCIANAARLGHTTLGTSMYMNCGVPCKDCLVVLINAGVAECICTSMELYDEESEFLIDEGQICVRTYHGAGANNV